MSASGVVQTKQVPKDFTLLFFMHSLFWEQLLFIAESRARFDEMFIDTLQMASGPINMDVVF